jgi:hypothetical protein
MSVLAVNVRAGVDVAVATDVVNSGDKFPAEKLVTVPLLGATKLLTVVSICSQL